LGRVIVECVPNFSEGRNGETIESLIAAARSVAGAKLLDHTSDTDHNRTVLTIAGEPVAVAEAAFRAVAEAVRRIALPAHQGVHPRIGAADVVPFVPVAGVTLDDCVELACATGQRIWNELEVPVYLYEAAARDRSRSGLETLRSRSFTGEPDYGAGRHRTAGATVVGARRFLVAWNINFDSHDLTHDVEAAREIARAIRESSGGLKCVKALAFELRSRNQVQVSVNLTDFEATPLHIVFDRIR
jgi:glutamate formiminotransferase